MQMTNFEAFESWETGALIVGRATCSSQILGISLSVMGGRRGWIGIWTCDRCGITCRVVGMLTRFLCGNEGKSRDLMIIVEWSRAVVPRKETTSCGMM
jgi:hypothetical protein